MSNATADKLKPKYENAEQERVDRELGGRYAKGNPGGPGNPFGRQVALLRKTILADATPDRVQALVKKIYDMAMDGILAAAKLYLSYAVGKPTPMADPDRVDFHEMEIYRETVPLKQELTGMMQTGTPEYLLEVARFTRPLVGAIHQQTLMDGFRNSLETSGERKAQEAKEEAEAERLLNSPGPELPDGLEQKLWPSPNPVMSVQGVTQMYVRCTGPLGYGFLGGDAERDQRGHGINLGRWAMSPLSPTW